MAGATQSEVDQQVASVPRGLVRLMVTATPPGASVTPDDIDPETGMYMVYLNLVRSFKLLLEMFNMQMDK